MKQFDIPTLATISASSAEPLYVASGIVPGGGKTPPPTTPEGDWTFSTKWTGHNGGSHSVCNIEAHNHGNKSGDNLQMTFQVYGFKLVEVTQASGISITNVTETGFTLNRSNHFNPNENIGFTVDIIADVNGVIGAVGDSGDPLSAINKKIICTSYIAS